MKAPELVLTSLSWLSPESLSATADLFNSDFAYDNPTITKINKIENSGISILLIENEKAQLEKIETYN